MSGTKPDSGAPQSDARRSSPAAARNREPILEVLRRVLPQHGQVLEIASGTGEHAVHFARALPHLEFQPSDPDPDARRSIDAWREETGLPNLQAAIPIDASEASWAIAPGLAAALCANMIHISPWPAARGLLQGVGQRLAPGAPLILYGPFLREGVATSQSNLDFDASLRARNPTWGIRSLEAVVQEAESHGLQLDEVVEMPANNLILVLRRAA
jgi:hypothetical protein